MSMARRRTVVRHIQKLEQRTMAVIVKILRRDVGAPAGKLADAELHFSGGELDGLKLIGFAIWQGRGQPVVSFPDRRFTIDGHHRRFLLLRAIADAGAERRLRDRVLEAYAASEKAAAAAT